MGKTSSTVKNRYNAKAYDRIQLVVPKGRKADIDAYVKTRGESVNGLINALLRSELGQSEEEWKRSTEESSGEA